MIPGLAYTSDIGIDNLLRRRFLTSVGLLHGFGSQSQPVTAAERPFHCILNPKNSKSYTFVINHLLGSATAGVFEFRDSTEAQVLATAATEDFGLYADRAQFGGLVGGTFTNTKFWRGATNGGIIPNPPGISRATGISGFGSLIQKGEGAVLILKPDQAFTVSHQTVATDLYSRWTFLEVPVVAATEEDRFVAGILAALSGAGRQ